MPPSSSSSGKQIKYTTSNDVTVLARALTIAYFNSADDKIRDTSWKISGHKLALLTYIEMNGCGGDLVKEKRCNYS